jgi:hypothetical protein
MVCTAIGNPNLSVVGGTEYGSTGDEDVIYVLMASDLYLWESDIRARILPEVQSAALSVVCQVYSNLAFSSARYPSSVVSITGLSAPVW